MCDCSGVALTGARESLRSPGPGPWLWRLVKRTFILTTGVQNLSLGSAAGRLALAGGSANHEHGGSGYARSETQQMKSREVHHREEGIGGRKRPERVDVGMHDAIEERMRQASGEPACERRSPLNLRLDARVGGDLKPTADGADSCTSEKADQSGD